MPSKEHSHKMPSQQKSLGLEASLDQYRKSMVKYRLMQAQWEQRYPLPSQQRQNKRQCLAQRRALRPKYRVLRLPPHA